jgi:serine/threonine protein kinase
MHGTLPSDVADHSSPTDARSLELPGTPSLVAPPTPRPGFRRGDVIGPYTILDSIGEGGFGTVYLADQREPVRRRVALKVVKPGMDSAEVIARFNAERHALSVMDHPNVARVLDAGLTPDHRPYFAMEFVPGVPITDFCDQNRLTMKERLELFISVCRAIQHAHQKGIIHRDLKPSNILVTTIDAAPVPKVIDFGIAKAMGQSLSGATVYTEVGRMIGTLEYMSPEQAGGGQDIDTRTDIYSLGVILYQLLSGSLPFESATLRRAGYEAIQKIIREVDPPKPSTRLSHTGDPGGPNPSTRPRTPPMKSPGTAAPMSPVSAASSAAISTGSR